MLSTTLNVLYKDIVNKAGWLTLQVTDRLDRKAWSKDCCQSLGTLAHEIDKYIFFILLVRIFFSFFNVKT